MDSAIVVKVKYGETLRRFNARIVDAQLDLGINELRGKVTGLFNFPPDADLTLTYIDEDGDVITLADEEDLHDVVRQSLNPLRITVLLNGEKSSKSLPRSSASATPLRSPQVQQSAQNLNPSVSDILKSVPEAMGEGFAKLSTELASKAALSTPGLAELVDTLSKMRLTYLKHGSEFQPPSVLSAPGGASKSSMAPPKVDDGTSGMLPNRTAEVPSLKDQVLPNTESREHAIGVSVGNVSNGAEAVLFPNIDPSTAVPRPFSLDEHNRKFGLSLTFKPFVPDGPLGPPSENDRNMGESHPGLKSIGAIHPPVYIKREGKMKFSGDSGNSSGSYFAPSAVNECPFSGINVASDSTAPPHYYATPASSGIPFKRSYNQSEIFGNIFHRGVRCDGCGVHPITGPRFKSKVKENYDLCTICFDEMGNDADYIRMDRPVTCKSFKGLNDPKHYRVRPPPTLEHQVFRGCEMRQHRPKLDSRFIQDVNILDGTIMAPSTPFTKIWRMRNNGTIVWPRGTQLIWIGGDKLTDVVSVDVQIPANGLLVEKEIDIAVDFKAPGLPGRYMSYWRMAFPSGQKFGQRVWVLIQVESENDYWSGSTQGFNLNLPPVISGSDFQGQVVDVSVEPMVDDSLPHDHSYRTTELVEPIVEINTNKDQEINFPINNNLFVGGGVSSPAPPVASSSVSYPIIDLSEVAPPIPASLQSHKTDEAASAQVGGDNDVEQTLLRELEEMGFKQVDLNKEILRTNEYDLEQSVDDLCGFAEWDPILEELQEMGFRDKEMNKRLLKKNNGSIKRVVMDLMTGEKA